MRGIILAGGGGTRLKPLTGIMNKHLLPIYNKPMVLYPLETLKTLGIKDIMIVSGGDHIGWFTDFLGDGSKYNVNLTYRVQRKAGGIAEALALAKDFVGNDYCMVILGDNIFDNDQLFSIIPAEDLDKTRAHIFIKEVPDPQRFGVPVFEYETDKVIKIEEKPAEPRSVYAVTGLYGYPPEVFNMISTLKPSARGELEITDVNNYFVDKGLINCVKLSGFWSDAGTFDSLLSAANWAQNHLSLDK
jgi:glucose-1-phosphate thymidylyltransferase